MKTHSASLHAVARSLRHPCAVPGRITDPKIELGPWRHVLATFIKAVRFEVPLGYQDETGFHYGEEPGQTKICYCGDI